MVTVKIQFGTGKDRVVMTDEAESLVEYIEYLKSVNWDVSQITKAQVIKQGTK